jgi:immune inhibitor A
MNFSQFSYGQMGVFRYNNSIPPPGRKAPFGAKNPMDKKTITLLTIIVLLVIILCCVCSAAAYLIGGDLLSSSLQNQVVNLEPLILPEPTSTVEIIRPPEETDVSGAPTREAYTVPSETLETLANTNLPIHNPVDLAERLKGIKDIPLTLDPPPATLQVGAEDTFWTSNLDNNQHLEVNATLQYVTDHLYFWVQDGLRYDSDALAELAETFEHQIYPTDRAFFGSEWTPGVDGDPHIYILLADGLGFSVAGYYSSSDEYLPLTNEYSNAHEMFFLNYDTTLLDDEFTYGVLAHEFEHMIHWNLDQNEESYIDEGFAEVASFLNGYENGGFDAYFTIEPDLQLNDWADPSLADTTPHYGASFLFLTYFLSRFGEEATRALAAHPENGLDSVDAVLEEIGAQDPLTGSPYTTDDLFIDWVIATFLNDGSVGDGRFTYSNYPDAPSTHADRTGCPSEPITSSVHQYGADIIGISCPGGSVLHFEGSIQTRLLPTDAHSGSYAFWSNKGNQSDMTLTRSFDLTQEDGPLTLNYWTWYDIEQDYDLVYLEASTDGENWEILVTPSGTADDPTGNSYGWGYTGQSGGDGRWIQETVDLSRFAGEEVQLRFEYITDEAVTGEGLYLDDISIPEIGYQEDFESGDGGWLGDGFVNIQNVLPQSYRLALITLGDEPTVQYIPLNSDNTAVIALPSSGQEAVLVISGTTRHTRQVAPYRIWADTP